MTRRGVEGPRHCSQAETSSGDRSPHRGDDDHDHADADENVADAEHVRERDPGRQGEDVGEGLEDGFRDDRAVRVGGRGGLAKGRHRPGVGRHVAAVEHDRDEIRDRTERHEGHTGDPEVRQDRSDHHGRGDDVDRRPQLADQVAHGRREQDDLDEQAGDHHPAEAELQRRKTGRTAAEEEPEGEPDRDGVQDEHQMLRASVLRVGRHADACPTLNGRSSASPSTSADPSTVPIAAMGRRDPPSFRNRSVASASAGRANR